MKNQLLLALIIILSPAFAYSQTLTVNVVGFTATEFETFPLNNFAIDGTIVDYDGFTSTSAIHIAVFDTNCVPWGTKWTDTSINPPIVYNPDHDFGQRNSDGIARNRSEYYFIFGYSGMHSLNQLDTMINAIPNGYTILLYSWQRSRSSYAQAYYPAFVSNITNLGFTGYLSTDSLPFAFVAKKGDSSSAQWVIGDSLRANISLLYNLGCSSATTLIEQDLKINLYPNPTTGIAFLQTNNFKSGTLSIYNQCGQLISNDKVVGNTIAIDLTNNAAGLYFYVLNDIIGNTHAKGKLIKQ